MPEGNRRPVKDYFLLVEDDDNHAKIVERSMRSQSAESALVRVKDGEEALRYLHEKSVSHGDLPKIILLDLKLPKRDGHEVLAELKKDQNLQSIPVVILTTSDAEDDKLRAYRHNANSYLVKPLDRNAFAEMIQDLSSYWGHWNQSTSVNRHEAKHESRGSQSPFN